MRPGRGRPCRPRGRARIAAVLYARVVESVWSAATHNGVDLLALDQHPPARPRRGGYDPPTLLAALAPQTALLAWPGRAAVELCKLPHDETAVGPHPQPVHPPLRIRTQL